MIWRLFNYLLTAAISNRMLIKNKIKHKVKTNTKEFIYMKFKGYDFLKIKDKLTICMI